MSEAVAYLSDPLLIDWQTESPFASLLAEAMREWSNTDIAMINAGVLLQPLSKGEVTKAGLHEVCPHPINPAILTVSGQQLLEIIKYGQNRQLIEKQVKGFGFRGKQIGAMIYDGLTFPSSRDDHEGFYIHGEPLNFEKTYTLATVDMFTFGKLYPPISDHSSIRYLMPEFLRDIIAWKLSSFN
nr:5'-nucleotidase C-terminal domain-containing protein [Texcoconibacillus texcoconensis]